MAPILVWFLYDFRIADHPALSAAVASGAPVIPVYVHDPRAEAPWHPGAARQWWMHHSLTSLQQSLAGLGLPLVIRRGDSAVELKRLAQEVGATRILANERWIPALRNRDARLTADLKAGGLQVEWFDGGTLLHDPRALTTGSGGSYTVFTPFWRKLRVTVRVPAPLPAPMVTPGQRPARVPESLTIEALGLLPRIAWDAGFHATWTPGEAAAHARLNAFVSGPIAHYHAQRNLPSVEGSTRLSPSLVHGEITVRQAWHAAATAQANSSDAAFRDECEHFLRELAWRDFSYHVLFHRSDTPDHPLKPKYAAFPWRDDPQGLKVWQQGRTGFPMVDAGMRQLWTTGWMHNRVRMVVASFLTKDLLVPWQQGAAWFWDTLVDADLANNTMGWQWAAGCGADAQPFFRIFNPASQGTTFDPEGAYVRQWVPELASMPNRWIHAPETCPERQRLAPAYPAPMVNHSEARDRALAALRSMGEATS